MNSTKNKALTPILSTGLSGLVGSKFAADFKHKYNFTNLDISDSENPTDITDYSQVSAALNNSDSEFVVHFAAFTNVGVAWEQKGDKSGLAYQVNVIGTQNLIKACLQTNKHLIHISTAFVFDGNQDGYYTESDPTNPIEWYGETKALSEADIQAVNFPWTILRIDFPFRSDPFPRLDIVRKTIETAEKGFPLFNNHFFGPTYIDDFAKVIDWVIRTKTTGLYNASSGEQWSDFDFGKKISELHGLDLEITAGNIDDYLKKLQRPYQRNTALDNSKLKAMLDFELTPIEQALADVELNA
jgi:dTDP-4-dehydrorhamnose reductase